MVFVEVDIPDSDMVPPFHHKCTPILRAAHIFRLTHPRIAYLCVHGALEMSYRLDPLVLDRGVMGVLPFRMSLQIWIDSNDKTSEQGQFQPNTDLPYLQSFCLDYYDKNIISVIKMLANKYLQVDSSALQAASPPDVKPGSDPLNGLIHACKTALVLFDCLELLSKDVQLPSQILEAHTALKQLVQIFKPYNVIPTTLYGYHPPIKTIPELQAALDELTGKPLPVTPKQKQDEDIMLKRVNNPSSAQVRQRPACGNSKPTVLETKTVGLWDTPRVPKLSVVRCLLYFLLFAVLFLILGIELCVYFNNQKYVV